MIYMCSMFDGMYLEYPHQESSVRLDSHANPIITHFPSALQGKVVPSRSRWRNFRDVKSWTLFATSHTLTSQRKRRNKIQRIRFRHLTGYPRTNKYLIGTRQKDCSTRVRLPIVRSVSIEKVYSPQPTQYILLCNRCPL